MLENAFYLIQHVFMDENILRTLLSFRIWLAISVVLAVATWILSAQFAKLWNRKFHQKPIHYVLGGLAATITFIAVMSWFLVSNLEPITKLYIGFWSQELKADQEWGQATFATAYEEVKEQGIENFYGVPSPDQPDSYIPINHDASRIKAAYVYANEAYENFGDTHPFLAFILDARVGLAEDSIKQDVDTYLAGGYGSSNDSQTSQDLDFSVFGGLLESALNTITDFSSASSASASGGSRMYPAERAVDLATAYLQISLAENAHRTVLIGRVVVFFGFLLLQAIPFGIIGYAAYQDIKIK